MDNNLLLFWYDAAEQPAVIVVLCCCTGVKSSISHAKFLSPTFLFAVCHELGSEIEWRKTL
jgi:hypothetical protein